jgi:hypothetical protein
MPQPVDWREKKNTREQQQNERQDEVEHQKFGPT